MNKLLNNLLGMYKQAKLNKKAEEDLIEVGWGLYTNDEYEIKENALYGGGEIKEVNKSFWDKINKDIEKVEMWFLKDGYKQFFAKVRDEGHGKDSELGGTAWMTKQQIQDFIDRAERTDGNRYTIREEIGGINVPFDYDETIFFELVIFVDETILDDLNIESKRVSKNKKLSSKNTKLRKKASAFKVVKMTNNDFVDLSDSIKDVGDELWGILYGKIVNVIAVIIGENKVLYEPLINDEETQKIYDEAQTGSIETVELLPGDDTYADIGFVAKESSKNKKLTKKADEDLNKEYKLLGNGLPTFDFNKKIIDFLDGINKKFDKFCVKIYGKIVCFNEIKDKKLITDKGEEFDYRDFGSSLLLKIYNKLKDNKQSSKTKVVAKQAKIELVEGVWYKVFGYPLSVKYLGEGKGGMKRFEKADGTEIIFDADVEIEPYEYSYSPFSNDKQATKKKAVLQVSENGMGYVLPNGQVVYPGDEALLKSEKRANERMLEKDKKELERLEKIIAEYPDINFDKNPDSVKFQIPRLKKGIEYLELFNETIEDILNAFKENKLPRQATKKQAKKLEFEDDIVEVTDKKGKVIYAGMFDYLDYDMKEDFYDTAKTKWIGNKYKISLPNGEYYLKVKGHKNNKLDKQATIKQENGVYNVYSESGKCLGKGYKTKEEAEKRLKQVEYFKHKDKKAAIGYDFYGPKIMPDEAEGTFRIKYYGGPGKIDYLRKSKNGKYHWVEQTHFDYNNDKPFETTDYELAKKLVDQFGGEIETVANKQTKNKRTSLKQVVISKMAENKK